MLLYTGSTFWPSTVKPAPFREQLATSTICDVVVVGSGVTGAMAAYELARAGLDVVVVDRRTIASGSTVASTALLQYELDKPLLELAKDVGREHAELAYLACRDGLNDILELVGTLGVDCELKVRQSLFLCRTQEETAELRAEAKARQRIGLQVEYLDAAGLKSEFGIDRPGALLSGFAMEINPLKLTHALLLAAQALGARIYGNVEVQMPAASADGNAGHIIDAGAGRSIFCDQIVLATGYEAIDKYPFIKHSVKLKTTYAAVTRPIFGTPWPGGALIWETGSPYFYARSVADGRVMMGGMDTPFAEPAPRQATIVRNGEILAEVLLRMFPQLNVTLDHAWSGTFIETADAMPYIGTLPNAPTTHFALGYGGNGITFSMIAAQIIRDRITGRPNSVAPLFAFER